MKKIEITQYIPAFDVFVISATIDGRPSTHEVPAIAFAYGTEESEAALSDTALTDIADLLKEASAYYDGFTEHSPEVMNGLQFVDGEFIADLSEKFGELNDNRFAVIAGNLFDLTSYVGCDDESLDSNILEVYDADGIYNASCGGELSHVMNEKPLFRLRFVSGNDATDKFIELLSNAAAYGRSY